jgi:hypothetical protein
MTHAHKVPTEVFESSTVQMKALETIFVMVLLFNTNDGG